MTDKQWDGMLKMVLKIVAKCETIEEAVREIADLSRAVPRDDDRK